MGQAASSLSSASPDEVAAPPPPPPLPAMNKAMAAMVARPPLHCVFYYEARVVSGQLQLPLVYAKPAGDDAAPGTRLMDLELWLREQFQLPGGASVFAVVPAEELYSPPYPLVMLNTVASKLYAAYEPERVPVLHLALVVRSMSLLRQAVLRGDDPDSPYCPISAAALAQREPSVARQYARMRFVRNMQNYGFARLEGSPAQAAVPQRAFESVRRWLDAQLARPHAERWRDRVDARADRADDGGDDDHHHQHHLMTTRVSKGRFVGFAADRNREYLQLRRPIAASGTVWPPAYFADNAEFAMEMLALLNVLDDLGRDCMRAICDVLNIDAHWMLNELLEDTTPPPASEDQVTSVDKSYQYGPSVLRIYNYRNKGANAHPEDASCAVHADLGLVTVSPVATVPGLQMWNMDRMTWTDVEADAAPTHFSVFAGETLGFLTHGVIKAPLHRVPPISVDSEGTRRMSMPYFLRARPDKVLNPHAKPAVQITTRDFMEDIVFRKRPWRRDEGKNSTPDY